MRPLARPATLALALALSAPAGATTLHTAPIGYIAAGWKAFCQLRNVGTSTITATIEEIEFLGSNGPVSGTTFSLDPGHAASKQIPMGSCRFTVSTSAKNVRAAAIYYDGLDYRLAVPAR